MRSALFGLCLVPVLFSACSSTDDQPASAGGAAGMAGFAAHDAGAAGASVDAGAGGASEQAGAAGEAGADASAGGSGSNECRESGAGDIDLVVTGLPQTVAASIVISGPHDALESESTTLSDVPGGAYSVTAKRVYDADPVVRTAYDGQVDSPTFCLHDGGTQSVAVSYAKVVPSNQLWTLNGNGGAAALLGFAASKLTDSGSPAASSAVHVPIGTAMAFDADGNLWAAGATVADPTLVRYAAASLSGVGIPGTDFAFNLALGCVPAVKGVALDATGNVWLSACGRQVLRIDWQHATPGAYQAPVDIDANVTLTGFDEQNEDLAFDSAGNLWVAAGGKLLRFDRERLSHNDGAAPDLVLDATTDEVSPQALAANFLAFDVAGNLWASDFDGNAVFEVGKADLDDTGTHTAVAKVHVTLAVQALLSRPAFDDEGSLWLSLTAGKFGKLTAEQLAVSSSPGSPTVPAFVISSPDVGYADGMAFFPAASGLPLPSAQP
ncbi:MAG TPA: hypothetical protein VER12_01445 [Polyangiaceae bacterium]|nr:hypothetical protein [Polyangiaceae bacterium]